MDINICDNLKELRKKKNNTQEDLAEFLNISIAAVSKWERGESYPDIELLPRIAVFYDTTVDDLLGVGETRKNHKISEYRRQTGEFYISGDTLANVELWRNAAKEFPNDNNVMMYLITALTNAANGAFLSSNEDNEANKNRLLKEAVEIGEVLVAKAVDQHIMYIAMNRLSMAYKALGEIEKAVKIANKLPTAWVSKEIELLRVLKGEELKIHSQNFLLSLIDSFSNTIVSLSYCDYNNEQTIQIHKKAIKIIELLFEDADYGARHMYLSSWHRVIATACAKMNDADVVIENLNAAAEHAIAYELLEEDAPHTSLLFNALKTQRHGKTYMTSEPQNLLKVLTFEHFDFCRDDERFIEIKNKLMAVAIEDAKA